MARSVGCTTVRRAWSVDLPSRQLLVRMTERLDRFVGHDDAIKNAVVATVPARRAAAPEEIAEAIVWGASAKAAYLTGQSAAIDGGGYVAQ